MSFRARPPCAITLRLKKLSDYRAIIFDVDGTLYDQRKLRLIMARQLLCHYALRPHRVGELKIIKTFRTFREHTTFDRGDLSTWQYQRVAEQLHIEPKQVQAVIEKWMYRAPLPYLRACVDRDLAGIIRTIKSLDITTIAYSDYPAVAKLAALEIEMDYVFSATDPLINCLKPDPRGLNVILQQLLLSPHDCLFIGDRDERDGLCARQAGMDYLILPSAWSQRKHFYLVPPFSQAPS